MMGRRRKGLSGGIHRRNYPSPYRRGQPQRRQLAIKAMPHFVLSQHSDLTAPPVGQGAVTTIRKLILQQSSARDHTCTPDRRPQASVSTQPTHTRCRARPERCATQISLETYKNPNGCTTPDVLTDLSSFLHGSPTVRCVHDVLLLESLFDCSAPVLIGVAKGP